MKKLLLSLGVVASVTAPVVLAVSCGNDDQGTTSSMKEVSNQEGTITIKYEGTTVKSIEVNNFQGDLTEMMRNVMNLATANNITPEAGVNPITLVHVTGNPTLEAAVQAEVTSLNAPEDTTTPVVPGTTTQTGGTTNVQPTPDTTTPVVPDTTSQTGGTTNVQPEPVDTTTQTGGSTNVQPAPDTTMQQQIEVNDGDITIDTNAVQQMTEQEINDLIADIHSNNDDNFELTIIGRTTHKPGFAGAPAPIDHTLSVTILADQRQSITKATLWDAINSEQVTDNSNANSLDAWSFVLLDKTFNGSHTLTLNEVAGEFQSMAMDTHTFFNAPEGNEESRRIVTSEESYEALIASDNGENPITKTIGNTSTLSFFFPVSFGLPSADIIKSINDSVPTVVKRGSLIGIPGRHTRDKSFTANGVSCLATNETHNGVERFVIRFSAETSMIGNKGWWDVQGPEDILSVYDTQSGPFVLAFMDVLMELPEPTAPAAP